MKLLKIFTILLFVTSILFSKEVEPLEVDELESYIQKNVIVIDIRKEEDWKKTGVIPGSYRIPYIKTSDNRNEKKWLLILVRLIKEKNRAFVLISKDGVDAKDLANRLYKEKKFTNIKYLNGGIDSWIDAHRRVINY